MSLLHQYALLAPTADEWALALVVASRLHQPMVKTALAVVDALGGGGRVGGGGEPGWRR